MVGAGEGGRGEDVFPYHPTFQSFCLYSSSTLSGISKLSKGGRLSECVHRRNLKTRRVTRPEEGFEMTK